MTDDTLPALVVDNISKSYSLSRDLSRGGEIGGILRTIFTGKTPTKLVGEQILALTGVSFDLKIGKALGVVGRNGSGKSTLMKVIAGIVSTDTGSVDVNGSVQALINLGAGFKPDLTGRENLKTWIAIRGFSSKKALEIEEEIVKFADLGEFIDKIMRTYSTGMSARLGFALCTHLEPSILIVDEALSVGDGAFQNKCLLKLEELRAAGMSLVLVSHSMTHIIQFCDEVIWLNKGKVIVKGDVAPGTRAYMSWLTAVASKDVDPMEFIAENPHLLDPKVEQEKEKTNTAHVIERRKEKKTLEFNPLPLAIPEGEIGEKVAAEVFGVAVDRDPRLSDIKLSLYNPDRANGQPMTSEPLIIDYEFKIADPGALKLNISLHFYTENAESLSTVSTLQHQLFEETVTGTVKARVKIDQLSLMPGDYVLMMPIHAGRAYLARPFAAELKVESTMHPLFGKFQLSHTYEFVKIES